MLRPYQTAALEASKEKKQSGVYRQLIAMPTGTGKTVVFASMPQFFDLKKRMLVLVHREELAEQARDKISRWNPTLRVGVEMGDKRSSRDDNVVVASVQTLGRKDSPRLLKFDPNDFPLVVCDEAHHSTADSYKTIFEYFGLMEENTDKLLVGVTATPHRSDGAALGQVYDEIVYEMSIEDAIKQGWLVDIKGLKISTNTDLSKVRTTAGDFNQRDLESTVNTLERNELIVRSWLKNAAVRQTVAFTVDVQHAKDLAQTYCEFGIRAEAIWSGDPDRAAKIARHKSGETQVICNCGIMTEGYDDWQISCIVLAAPTKSAIKYIQMAGRATRIEEGINNLKEARAAGTKLRKEDCLLLDFCDNSGRHSLVTMGTIFGLPAKLNPEGQSLLAIKAKLEEVKTKHPSIDFDKLSTMEKLPMLVEAVNLFRFTFASEVEENSVLAWIKLSEELYVLNIPTREQCRVQRNLLGKWHAEISVDGNRTQATFGTLKEAFGFADKMIENLGRSYLHLLRQKVGRWGTDKASDAQMILLRKFYGSRVPSNLTKAEASKLVSEFTSRKGRQKI